MKKQHVIIFVTLTAILVTAWFYVEKKNARAVRPLAAGADLKAYLDNLPEDIQIFSFALDGKKYVELVRMPNASGLNLSSGPSVYIFNEKGEFVDWCRDIGDTPSFEKKWKGFPNTVPISAVEAMDLDGSHKIK